MSKRRHVFISHHHADDVGVSSMTTLLARRGYEIRNSSIRINKPENQRRLDQGRVSDRTIARLLRMKMAWASTVVVLIGKETHTRKWVNWEIEKANSLGKRIIGVYERGGTDYQVPPALEDSANAIVNWNADSIIGAVEGRNNAFEKAGGGRREPVHSSATSRC